MSGLLIKKAALLPFIEHFAAFLFKKLLNKTNYTALLA
tara:strand:- start:4163 stop:4276 length:114 start_codon:yes stop_codon:yes gene_type:complete